MAATNGITKRTNFYSADPAHLVRAEGWNPRIDFGNIESLAASIKENGFMPNKPILVKRNAEGKFQIIDGDRRFSAVEHLLKNGHEFPEGIPIVLQSKEVDDLQSLVNMFISNLGKPFLPLEEAEAFKRMRDGGMTLEAVSSKTGKSVVHIINTLALIQAGDGLKDALASGEISTTLAKDIAVKTKGDVEKQNELVEQAKTDKKAAQEAVKAMKKQKQKKQEEKATFKMLTQSQVETRLGVAEGHLHSSGLNLVDLDEEAMAMFVVESDERNAAFQYGVVQALKAVLGHSVKLYI